MKFALVHLIVGDIGAGKSTYAARLAAAEGAHVIANDEWMRALFFADLPPAPSCEWMLERTRRIERVAVTEAARLAALGLPVILDLGFLERSQRDRVRAALAEAGAPSRLHWLDVDAAERWRRVEARNRNRGPTFQFAVSRADFDLCARLFQPLDADEAAGAVVVSA